MPPSPGIKQQVAKLGYVAFTKDEFNKRISDYYTYQTGIGTNILLMTVISFIVGLSISGQTFYTFILENLEKFGALKAIGAKGRELVYMILFMATFTALTGYGLGVGLVTLMISIAQVPPAQLRRDDHVLEPGPGLRHGAADRRDFQLRRGAEGPEGRALRHLQGLAHAAPFRLGAGDGPPAAKKG